MSEESLDDDQLQASVTTNGCRCPVSMTEPAAILGGSRCWLRFSVRGSLYGVVVVTGRILALVHRW